MVDEVMLKELCPDPYKFAVTYRIGYMVCGSSDRNLAHALLREEFPQPWQAELLTSIRSGWLEMWAQFFLAEALDRLRRAP